MRPVPGLAIEQQPDNALFACLLCAEAANDGEPGMSAVAQVVMNRVRHVGRWPGTIKGVILQPWQFSCLNPNAPERDRFLTAADREPDAYAIAEFIVTEAVSGSLPDTVGPANVYCTNGAHGTLALWGFDDSAHVAAGHPPRWYSIQCIETGITHLCAVIGRQSYGVTV